MLWSAKNSIFTLKESIYSWLSILVIWEASTKVEKWVKLYEIPDIKSDLWTKPFIIATTYDHPCHADPSRNKKAPILFHFQVCRTRKLTPTAFPPIPIGSMYGIFTYIYIHLPQKSSIHVGKYTSPMDPMAFLKWCSPHCKKKHSTLLLRTPWLQL